MIAHPAKRIRVGLRLMLLLVALFCVWCAYYRAYTDLRREKIKMQLATLENEQDGVAKIVKYNGTPSPQRVAQLAKLNVEIAEKKRALGEK